MTDIALFGTSADPPTEGHKAILKWLSNRYDWVAVWASNNPFKAHPTSLDHRMTMLQLLILEIDPVRENISLNRELSSPRSLETVQTAREQWGDEVNLTLVVGSDLIAQMPKWYRIQDLLQQVQLLIVPRSGYPIKEEHLETLRQLGGQCAIADFTPPPVSSTAYRDRGDISAIAKPVEDYIHREQLYAWHKPVPTQ
ncbi:nicotinate-nucleotide adenylyltransferase [Lusitaniella coriacea LEGE 07157]|uniref:nicotinate-nucleotide adenylyltransferase n=1 Tax=Lusitaniella coriacea LEGE 07157 TaxID=945747 RepID=A0A8J7J2A8_9CYAN|nr:nicotinate-nucleotide adenylyltransferase [Lusitaniella coriacea]MBE9116284.1 nicotinate-nucleotide adenylyltransferase [Lusitaniella coriacea LEGE 07157]